PLPSTRGTLLAAAPEADVANHMREAIILATLAAHPALLPAFEAELDRAAMHDPAHERLRHALLTAVTEDRPPEALAEHLHAAAPDSLAQIMDQPHVRIAPPVRNCADTELARRCLSDEFAKLFARRAAEVETREAMEDMAHLADEGVTWRLGQAAEARHRSERSDLQDTTDLGEDRAALSRQLQDLIDSQVWEKRRR
ncbi:MAG: DNA primase, partial [Rhodobacteraceae bacterium]|nr:DNA primase [Paracoccaceae bacterium]